MTTERMEELRALCAEYARIKSEAESDLTHEAVARIANIGMKAFEALPELLDYVQKIESTKAQFLQTILDKNKRYQERYSTVQQMIDHYNNMANASVFSIGKIECCGRLEHDRS